MTSVTASLNNKIVLLMEEGINPLEALLQSYIPKCIFQTVPERIINLNSSIRKKIIFLQIYLNDERHWEDEEAMACFAQELGVTVEALRSPNIFTLDFVVGFLLDKVYKHALQTWPQWKENKINLSKAMLITWRKMQIILEDLAMAISASNDELTNQSKDSELWKDLDSISTLFIEGTFEDNKKKYDEYCNFLYMGQIAHAKTKGILLDMDFMTLADLNSHLEPGFLEYESELNKRNPMRFKINWTKDYIPSFSPKLWSNIFFYQRDQEKAFLDLQFYTSFSNNWGIKDFWNLSESYVGKATRNMRMKKIKLSQVIYLPVDIADRFFEPVEGAAPTCPSLKVKDTIELLLTEVVPPDIFFDHLNKERIGVRMIADRKIQLRQLLIEFSRYRQISLSLKKPKDDLKTVFEEKKKIERTQENSRVLGAIIKMKSMLSRKRKKREASESQMEEKEREESLKAIDKDADDSQIEDIIEGRSPQVIDTESSAELEIKDSITIENAHNSSNLSLEKNAQDYNLEATTMSSSLLEFVESNKLERSPTTSVTNLSSGSCEENSLYDFCNISESSMTDLDSSLSRSPSTSPPRKAPSGVSSLSNSSHFQLTPEILEKDSKLERLRAPLRDYYKKIIIHIHGGGFIAMNSAQSQPHTRMFSKVLDVPVFSIDYRLAPNPQYPYNLLDCIKAYLWVFEFINKVVDVVPEKVVLMGNSAGAGLCMSLTYWLIENNQRVPDLLELAYSCFSLDTRQFKTSKYIGLDDYFLHLSALKAVYDFYVPEGALIETDYYLSPVKAPDALLRKLPRTRLFIPLQDPLRDDQLLLASRIQKVGGDIWIYKFDHLEHGSLNVHSKEVPLAEQMRDMVVKEARIYFSEDSSQRLTQKSVA